MILTDQDRARLLEMQAAGHSEASLAITMTSMSIKNKRDAGVTVYRAPVLATK